MSCNTDFTQETNTMKTTTKQTDRTAAYKARFAEAAELLKVLAHHVENLGHEDLDAIHWGHVGDAGALVEALTTAAALTVNVDPIDAELPAALAAYRKQHGIK
jgi:hypothetical protein